MIGIGDFDAKARNRRKTVTREGQKLYNGKKYAQDKKTGYYICTTTPRKRLHVAIWEHEHGMEVPPGCIIHHKDWCKTNNSVENLTCVTVEDHNLIHNPPEQMEEIKVLDFITGEVVYYKSTNI